MFSVVFVCHSVCSHGVPIVIFTNDAIGQSQVTWGAPLSSPHMDPPDMFKLVHYVAQTDGKQAVHIWLKCLVWFGIRIREYVNLDWSWSLCVNSCLPGRKTATSLFVFYRPSLKTCCCMMLFPTGQLVNLHTREHMPQVSQNAFKLGFNGPISCTRTHIIWLRIKQSSNSFISIKDYTLQSNWYKLPL